MRLSASRPLILSACLSATAVAQTYIDLDFSRNVQPATEMYPNGSTLGPYYHSGTSMKFLNAGSYHGQAVDVRVSVIGLIDGMGPGFRETSTYEWVDWIPSYNGPAGGNDLGVYFRHDMNFAQPLGGIAWEMSFYFGDGTFSAPITLPGVRLLIYDHDGEPYQSESLRAYAADGLTGYQIHASSGIEVCEESHGVRFDARGEGHPETTAEGGVILYYENTSSIRLDHLSRTEPGLAVQNRGIFAAVDGDLGANGGNVSGFHSVVPVPEPGSAALFGAAGALALARRHREA